MKILLSRDYDNYILFISLIAILLVIPFVQEMPLLRFAVVAQYSFVMGYLVYSARHTRAVYLLDIAIALPSIVSIILDSIYQNNLTFIISYLSIIVFFLYLQYLSIMQIVNTHTVDTNTIFGAMNIYLIAGLIWAFTYALLQHIDPNAFHITTIKGLTKELEAFTYFSFTTITTLGYGDIVPLSSQARMLSILEAIFGQLYLAIVISKLVSISMNKESKDPVL